MAMTIGEWFARVITDTPTNIGMTVDKTERYGVNSLRERLILSEYRYPRFHYLRR